MSKIELKVRDGGLFAVWTMALSTPEEVEQWYDLEVKAAAVAHRVDLDEPIVLNYTGNGAFRDQLWRAWVLPGGGQQKAVHTVRRAIPPPKVKAGIETRWNSDRERWEKYLKTKGWVPA